MVKGQAFSLYHSLRLIALIIKITVLRNLHGTLHGNRPLRKFPTTMGKVQRVLKKPQLEMFCWRSSWYYENVPDLLEKSKKIVETFRKSLVEKFWKSLSTSSFLFIYHIYHMYLFRQSKVYSCNNKGFTIDIWNFKVQNNLFFIASFIWRDDI